MARVLERKPWDGIWKLHLEYMHDGKLYQSFPRVGAKVISGGNNVEYHLQIPLSNDGYIYRMTPDIEIARRDLALHRGSTHPEGIEGFAQLHREAASDFLPFVAFARKWFQCNSRDISQQVFYNGSANRVDVVMERRNYPRKGDKVSIALCFEPGWPIEEFDDISEYMCLSDGETEDEIQGEFQHSC